MRNCTMHSFFRWKEQLPCRVRVKLGVLLSSCLCIVTVVVGSSSGHTGQMTMSELAKTHTTQCAPGAHCVTVCLCDPCTPAGSTHPDTEYPSVYTTYNMYLTRYTDYRWEGTCTCMYLREQNWLSDALYVQNKLNVCTRVKFFVQYVYEYTGHVQKNRLLVEVCTCYLYMYIK